jgi:peptidoglycan/LPS O-acetylase OafA/YrhL
MTFPRPAGITWLCAFAMIAALYDLTMAQYDFWEPDDPGTVLWIATHATGARVQLGLTYVFATITLLTCFFILRAKNWARWTYLSVSVLRYALAFVLLAIDDSKQDLLYLRFRGAMVPGLLLLIMAFLVLFTRDARDFFIAAGRPHWRVMEEEDEREARRKKT